MLFVSCVSHAFASVHCCLVVTCLERADLLVLVGDVHSVLFTDLLINLKPEISMQPVCLLMIFLLFTLLYLMV